MRRAAKSCGVIALMAGWWPEDAQAEQFLSLPTSRVFPITCRWSCLNADGSTYNHRATDYGTPTNSEIRAAAGGEVVYLKNGLAPGQLVRDYQYGNWVKLQHPNGYETRYAHLLPNTITVQRGQRVEAGQLLGLSDNTGMSTGPHLHFEVRDAQGRRVNPYGDPPDYTGGCGPNALWMTCPPTSAPPPDADGDGYTVAAGDCDDANRDVHPGATESCNDRDDDCNGTPDDPWRAGLAQDIGNPCTVGIGACSNTGTWVCAPNGVTTVCSADPLPSQPESCNGLDDDCDGEADEDWRAGFTTDLGESCGIVWDDCATTSGVWTCTPDGLAVVCDASEPSPESRAATETCDGSDNDCNGVTDDVDPATLASNSSDCGSCGRGCTGDNICREGNCVSRCSYSPCIEYCRWYECGSCAGGCITDACFASCIGGGLGGFFAVRECLCRSGCWGCL